MLPFGVTTAPSSYSEIIAVTKRGAAGPTVTFALTAGSLPPGLSMPASSGSAAVITGNPAKTGTFNFTIKAADANLTSTQAYQITVTAAGPPDQLVCEPGDNGGFLESGTCGTPAQPGTEPTCTFTVQGTGDQGRPCIRCSRSPWTRISR